VFFSDSNSLHFPAIKKTGSCPVFLIVVEMAGIEPASESASTGIFSERSLRFFPPLRRHVRFIRASQAQRGIGYPVSPLYYREITQSFPAYLAPGSGPAGESGLTSLCGYYAANAKLVFSLPFILNVCPF